MKGSQYQISSALASSPWGSPCSPARVRDGIHHDPLNRAGVFDCFADRDISSAPEDWVTEGRW